MSFSYTGLSQVLEASIAGRVFKDEKAAQNAPEFKKALIDYMNSHWAFITESNEISAVTSEGCQRYFPVALASFTKNAVDIVINYRRRVEEGSMPADMHFSYAKAWVKSPLRREAVRVCRILPGDNRLGNDGLPTGGYINTFTGFDYPPESCRDADISLAQPWVEHIRERVCAGNAEHFEWVMNYMSSIYVRPGRKLMSTIVIAGDMQGSGKNLSIAPLQRLIGTDCWFSCESPDQLEGNNGWVEGRCLVVFDECCFSKKKERGALKKFITDNRMGMCDKWKRAWNGFIVGGSFFLSNERFSFPSEFADRRSLILPRMEHKLTDEEAAPMVRLKNVDARPVGRFLVEWAESHLAADWDAANPPKTEEAATQRGFTLTPLEQWWSYCLTKGTVGNVEEVNLTMPSTHDEKASFYFDNFKQYCKHTNMSIQSFGGPFKKISGATVNDRNKKHISYYCLPDYETLLDNFHKATGVQLNTGRNTDDVDDD